ncbi:hypothetical protein [Profundibacter sp.]
MEFNDRHEFGLDTDIMRKILQSYPRAFLDCLAQWAMASWQTDKFGDTFNIVDHLAEASDLSQGDILVPNLLRNIANMIELEIRRKITDVISEKGHDEAELIFCQGAGEKTRLCELFREVRALGGKI